MLRAQKDAVWADMIGAGFVIEEAMTVREQVGRVSEVTWSKVQAPSMTIARTQAYALRQLDALAEKMEHKTKIGDLAKASRDAEFAVREWLAVLARCFQLHDATAVLGIERGRQSLDARRWVDAAAEARDKVLETGAEGVNAAKRLGNETLDRARSMTGKLSGGIAERVLRRRGDGKERDEES